MAAESPVEIGDVAEPALVGDLRDVEVRVAPVDQQSMRLHHAFGENEGGKRRSVLFEQFSNVARRNAVARRNQLRRQVAAAEIALNVGADGAQPRRLGAALPRDLGVIAARAERRRPSAALLLGIGRPKACE